MDTPRPAASPNGSGIDLRQFHQVFFEEAGENLEQMEQMLLGIDIGSADDETLNAIFRCAHSVKGGAATFGFADVAELTHRMETLLDRLRRHELAPNVAMVDVLLQSCDALKAQLARHQGFEVDDVDTRPLVATIEALSEGGTPHVAEAGSPMAAPSPAAADPAPAASGGLRTLLLTVGPLPRPDVVDDIVDLFREVGGLGTLEALDGAPPADALHRFKVVTSCSDDDLLDLFGFHVARDQVCLAPFAAAAPDDRPTATDTPPAAAPAPPKAAPRAVVAPPDASTLRVSVDKLDQMINLVGELVITQAMLAQAAKGIDSGPLQQIAAGLAALERNTRDLQQAVMSVRMIPISLVFNRFPRMLRDLAARMGKKVELLTQGETTELDKGMIEKITDPLTHLVRNSCDHGIESPAERLARGKPAHGTITLAASHHGGSIVIEVRDDGRGLNRGKLLAKARQNGLDAPDTLSDPEVWNLIFAPGFSTADQVSDVSGRGVGMDVVRQNITSLGGAVEIESAEGVGMAVRVRLPLTLAIMDGMSVGVGDECYILPLASVVESFQWRAGLVRTVGGSGRVVQVREQVLPVIDLAQAFDVPRDSDPPADPIMVVVEADGARAALVVDDLVGQQQVVVKNLETHYRKVRGVSGATILGDGRVALIVDVAALVRRSRH
jgi:two-component system chemotaxis sensor kinase CheA